MKKSVVQIEHFFRKKNGVSCCISIRFWCNCSNFIGTHKWCVLYVYYMKISYISRKNVLLKLNTFFFEKMRYLLYFNPILMELFQHHRNAQMMRFKCVLHEKKSCISWKKSVVQIEHFFRKKQRYLLYFNSILMKLFQHHRNARIMRFTYVFHVNKL